MKKKYALIGLLAVLALAALACLSSATIDPNAPAGTTLFQDDFSGKSGGWDQQTAETGATEYGDGSYRIFVDAINTYIWANPKDMEFTDTRIEVDATKVDGPESNNMGIICRYVDEGNFYLFVIGSDGYFSMSKIVNQEETLIGSDQLGFNDQLIIPGNATNHIRADCIGSSFALYINGDLVAEATDSTFTSGNVGLIAGTWDTPGADIHFDNFTVVKP